MQFIVEPAVTVILGPNDHGKTNLLNALLHLNHDTPFDAERDLNWDSTDMAESLPAVTASFSLSTKEREWLLSEENEVREKINRRIVERAKSREEDSRGDEEDGVEEGDAQHAAGTVTASHQVAATAASPQNPQSPTATLGEEYEDEEEYDDELEEEDLPEEPLNAMTLSEIPIEVSLARVGADAKLAVHGLEKFSTDVRHGFTRFLPRFELIDPITRLTDSVSSDELKPGENEFMRGIFHYAGLDPDSCDDLFAQSYRTQMRITEASEQLDKTLKESWSQGKELRFRLTHNSKHERIDLQIQDPSVKSTYVRASRRSSGFTHYFSLKTILHSRQKDHPADSYILLFDEPGVFLHPSGQFDLLQVLETLAMESQILYVTHSLFMINKTFPTRHRLVMKNSEGTTIDGKPYVGRWEAVLSALGLTLTGSILFANHVVLTEGDSDPIYIYAIIQKAVKAGRCALDINSLAVMSTSESRHADVLLRMLCETKPKPRVGIIADGDKGGEERLRYVQGLIKQHEVAFKALTKGTSIEDHIPMIREVYVPALAAYVAKLMVSGGKPKPDESELAQKFVADFDEHFEKGKAPHGVADWAAKAAQNIGEITGQPSKVGIAREYAGRLLGMDDGGFKLDSRTKALTDWIQKEVGVPELRAIEKRILEHESTSD